MENVEIKTEMENGIMNEKCDRDWKQFLGMDFNSKNGKIL